MRGVRSGLDDLVGCRIFGCLSLDLLQRFNLMALYGMWIKAGHLC